MCELQHVSSVTPVLTLEAVTYFLSRPLSSSVYLPRESPFFTSSWLSHLAEGLADAEIAFPTGELMGDQGLYYSLTHSTHILTYTLYLFLSHLYLSKERNGFKIIW